MLQLLYICNQYNIIDYCIYIAGMVELDFKNKFEDKTSIALLKNHCFSKKYIVKLLQVLYIHLISAFD